MGFTRNSLVALGLVVVLSGCKDADPIEEELPAAVNVGGAEPQQGEPPAGDPTPGSYPQINEIGRAHV